MSDESTNPSRVLSVPADANYNTVDKWVFPDAPSTYQNELSRIVEKSFIQGGISRPADLVSFAYCNDVGIDVNHDVLPHTVLKHTISIHCGSQISDPVISSFSFLCDHTRGRLREYPYYNLNTATGHNRTLYDICFRPEIWSFNNTPIAVGTYAATGNCLYYNEQDPSNANTCPDADTDVRGGTIDYTPFSPTDDNDCATLNSDYSTIQVNNASNYYFNFGTNYYEKLPLPPYLFVVGTFPRSDNAITFSGYRVNNQTLEALNSTPVVHKYEIDKNITLGNINQEEKIIYNPSEVNITAGADNLRFPSNYTFKTIRATYPYEYEVNAADNDPDNGGPYLYKRDVPVTTDLRVDYHISGYPTNDPKYSSIYHLQSGSKLTIEPCVRIFDCTFDLQTGSKLFFENWETNQTNVNRYGTLLNGGKLTKAASHFYFQNKNEEGSILEFQSGSTIEAGSHVDTGFPQGPYTVEADAHVTFIANDEITLSDGFTAEAGSDFTASIADVSVAACRALRLANHHASNQPLKNSVAPTKFFSYSTISPNPANLTAEIKFGINSSEYLSLKIYDAYGRELKTIINHLKFDTGSYSQRVETSLLMPGVYYCKLFSGEEEEIMKLVKVN